jgi:hypothetical protein
MPRRPTPWLRVAVTLLVLAAVPALAFYGARVRDAAAAHRLAVAAWVASVEAAFERVPLLTAGEEALLRRSLNRRHVALARELGVPPVPGRDSLERVSLARGLVAVDRPSPWHVTGGGGASIPYLTPDAAASLDSLGTRFHALLDAAGLPRYRLVVTSLLRSTEDQAALRRRNANAAAGASSHEYGTTYDVHYRLFAFGDAGLLAPPAPPERLPGFVEAGLREGAARETREAFARFAEAYPSRLQALLGRALIALEDAGVLVTVMERGQPVFHTTAARRLAETGAAEAR